MKDKNCIRCKSCLQLCFRPRQWSRHDPFPVHRLTPVRLENSFNRIKVHRYSVGIAVFTTALLSFQPNTGGGWPNCEGGEKRTKADSRSFLSPPLFPLFFLFLSFFFTFLSDSGSIEWVIYTPIKITGIVNAAGFVEPWLVPQYRTRPIEIAPPTLATE